MNAAIAKAQKIMTFERLPCWLLYCDEHSDPYFSRIVSSKTIAPSVAVLSADDYYVIVSSLDVDNVPERDGARVLAYKKEEELWEKLEDVIRSLGMPPAIGLNYSTLRDAQVDVLGYGLYGYVTERIARLYDVDRKNVQFCSAERVIYAFSDRKEEDDIQKMRVAASRALEILESAFLQIQPGMTELDLVELVHGIAQERPHYFRDKGVVDQAYSWSEEFCPVALVGPSLVKGGHAMSSSQRVEHGHTVYFDFGVCLTFEDGSSWSSDIQRMGYVLRDDEVEAPGYVKKIFETLVDAISIGIDKIRPGMCGYELDEVVRGHVAAHGYPDYDHSTGHAIGELAHNPGTLIGMKERPLSQLKIQPYATYTIEPRIAVENGGSIEEMVLVTENGGVALCPRQLSLYLVGKGPQDSPGNQD